MPGAVELCSFLDSRNISSGGLIFARCHLLMKFSALLLRCIMSHGLLDVDCLLLLNFGLCYLLHFLSDLIHLLLYVELDLVALSSQPTATFFAKNIAALWAKSEAKGLLHFGQTIITSLSKFEIIIVEFFKSQSTATFWSNHRCNFELVKFIIAQYFWSKNIALELCEIAASFKYFQLQEHVVFHFYNFKFVTTTKVRAHKTILI